VTSRDSNFVCYARFIVLDARLIVLYALSNTFLERKIRLEKTHQSDTIGPMPLTISWKS